MNVQERLQLKRIPLDKWSTREQLCLAMAVLCSGDQNWMSVSRALKMMCGTNRPTDWFSQKFCAAQYGKLLENVETPKRKKRTATERDNPTDVTIIPGELIVRKLVQERTAELKKLVEEEQKEYRQLTEDIRALQSDTLTDEQVLAMWEQIEQENKEKEKEAQKHAQWLKEREERKIEMERAWRPGAIVSMSPTSNSNSSGSPSRGSPSIFVKGTGVTASGSLTPKTEPLETQSESPAATETPLKQGTSPLLTSLLKSPSSTPSNTTGQPQLATSMATRSLAPTITNLLTGQQTPTGTQSTSFAASQNVPNSGSSFFNFPSKHPQHQPQATTPSKAAPTLSKLLDPSRGKGSGGDAQGATVVEGGDDAVNIEDDQQLMEVFKELMPDDLADILTDNNGMIVSPELLEQDLENVQDLIQSSTTQGRPTPTGEVQKDPVKVEVKPTVVEEVASTETSEHQEKVEIEQGTIVEEETTIGEDVVESGEGLVTVVKEEVGEESVIESTILEPIEEVIEEQEETVEEHEVEDGVVEHVEEQLESGPLESRDGESPEEGDSPKEANSGPTEEVETLQTQVSESVNGESGEQIQGMMEEEAIDDDKTTESEQEMGEVNSTAYETEDMDQEPPTGQQPAAPIEERKTSTDNEDHFEDAKSTVGESSGNPPEEVDMKESKESSEEYKRTPTRVEVNSTPDASEKGRSKRDMPRRNRSMAPSEEKPAKVQLMEESESSSPSNISLRARLKERERSESPLVMDEDTSDMVIPRTRRRYSSTPVIDSVPSSPASGDDREYKNWKKSVLIAFNQFSTLHYKYSAVLVQQVPEEFKHIILRPMDLQTIKKNIESGVIRTTTEFQRDVLLMVQNAIMMNTRRDKDWTNLISEMMVEVDYWKRETEKNLSARDSDSAGGGGSSRDGQGKVRNRKSMRITTTS